jgi:hypothetical protein
MPKKTFIAITILVSFALILPGCNLPQRAAVQTPTSLVAALPQSSPTPTPVCANTYFPNAIYNQWEYSGTNSLVGEYTRIDTISSSNDTTFTQESVLGSASYSVSYDCSTTGLTSQDPIQQYAGALLNSPDAPVNVKLFANSGISLPSNITPGETWHQVVDFEATSPQLNVNGRFIFDYTAVRLESVTVQAGTFDALRVDGTIRIQITSLHVPAGTYTLTSWWVPGVGLVKSEGVSQVPGIDFNDSLQLVSFTPAQ